MENDHVQFAARSDRPVYQYGGGNGGRIHFCGEHCSYAFVGYMEGALNSGARLAKRLAVRDGVMQEAGAMR